MFGKFFYFFGIKLIIICTQIAAIAGYVVVCAEKSSGLHEIGRERVRESKRERRREGLRKTERARWRVCDGEWPLPLDAYLKSVSLEMASPAMPV